MKRETSGLTVRFFRGLSKKKKVTEFIHLQIGKELVNDLYSDFYDVLISCYSDFLSPDIIGRPHLVSTSQLVLHEMSGCPFTDLFEGIGGVGLS